MMGASDTQKGFTLIEVLVALTLMALVSLISWRGLETVQHTGEHLDARAEETLSLLRVLGQIERDILLHAGPDILPGSGAVLKETLQANNGMPPGIVWDATTGLGVVRDAGNGNWQQLRWFLEDGRLFRASGTPSHRLPLPLAEKSVIVLEQVSVLTVRVWHPSQGWVSPTQDVAANSRIRSGLAAPRGLEIALYRKGQGGDKPYRKVVLLP